FEIFVIAKDFCIRVVLPFMSERSDDKKPLIRGKIVPLHRVPCDVRRRCKWQELHGDEERFQNAPSPVPLDEWEDFPCAGEEERHEKNAVVLVKCEKNIRKNQRERSDVRPSFGREKTENADQGDDTASG